MPHNSSEVGRSNWTYAYRYRGASTETEFPPQRSFPAQSRSQPQRSDPGTIALQAIAGCEDHERDFPARQILLISDVSVGAYQHFIRAIGFGVPLSNRIFIG
jgi:hypothetical protein